MVEVCCECHADMNTGRKLTDEEYQLTTLLSSNVSHGYCNSCFVRKLEELDKAKAELEAALATAAEDEKIADNTRDYWMHRADGAER